MTRSLGYTNAPGLLNMVAEKSDFDELVITNFEIQIRFLTIFHPNQALEQLGRSKFAEDGGNVEAGSNGL